MADLIECRKCTSPYCRGCNLYILSRALHDGKFDGLMNANKLVVVPKEIAPVRHGRWIETTYPIGWDAVTCAECSECGEAFALDELGMDNMKNFMHFCPNCGALMDGKSTVEVGK